MDVGAARLVGGTGAVLASTTFEPPARPAAGAAGSTLPPPVRAAAGRVWFLTADGVLSGLGLDGRVVSAASVPLRPGQAASLAIAPDGTQAAVTIVTVPGPGGHWRVDQYRGPTGAGALPLTGSTDLGTQVPQPAMVAGWDRVGPVASLRTDLLGTGPAPASAFPGGLLVHLDERGGLSAPLGGPECGYALSTLPDGRALCAADATHVAVRDAGGTVEWQFRPVPALDHAPATLAPGGAAACAGGMVYRAAGGSLRLPDGFVAAGWANSGTVVGHLPDGRLALVRLDHPAAATALAATGYFAGAA